MRGFGKIGFVEKSTSGNAQAFRNPQKKKDKIRSMLAVFVLDFVEKVEK